MREKKRHARLGLTSLLWRYLLATVAAIAVILGGWWSTMMLMMRNGVVLPAYTAQSRLEETRQALALAQTFDGDSVAHWYRYVRLDEQGEVLEWSPMSERQREIALRAYAGDSMRRGFPYAQYHAFVPLRDGGTLILQYDYSVVYANAWAQRHLPDFQICALAVLLIILLAVCTGVTRHYTRILRTDAALLTRATGRIAQRELDGPPEGEARVRELADALGALEVLRDSLAKSLDEQWTQEQRQSRELRALAHDIKTPLTIISGHAELLLEEEMTQEQQSSVQMILRSARHIEDYTAQLRLILTQSEGEQRRQVSLKALFSDWRQEGEGLCAKKRIRFRAVLPQERVLIAEQEALRRAVLNLIDNAARFAPAEGEIALSAYEEGDRLVLRVQDNGPGFKAEILAHGGQAFCTGEASRSAEGHSGMGLYYARCVAQRHGGALRLTNTEGGACAEILLRIHGETC